ncbi:MAG TPA: hypothetical protein VLT16_15845 [Candidatus Limnocylindrales bacterium]|nr:hypothetical protein [Candidatus Limnocylindrales bacterium]
MLVTKNVVTREEVIAAIKDLAEKLGRSPRHPELVRVLNVTRRQIHRLFGGWAAALEESGCERLKAGGTELTMQDLFADWVTVARKMGRIPTIRQYERLSRYSVRPLKDRFKAWDKIPGALLEYGEARGLWAGSEDVKEMIQRRMDENTPGKRYRVAMAQTSTPEVIDVNLLYGQPLTGSAMATAPVNEMGVVYLFGVMARELGFVVLKLQAGFPDCEALRRLETGKWQRVRIEFEFESRNFVLHDHDPAACDVIVCWEHNWAGCPVEVVELKKAIAVEHRTGQQSHHALLRTY